MTDVRKSYRAVYISLAVLLVATVALAYLNRGDPELRRALEENREFQIRSDGELAATVNLQFLLGLGPQEFTATFSTSLTTPREATLRGVELRILIDALDINASGAGQFIVSGLDGYYSALSREEVEREENVYICFSMDGVVLKARSEGGYGPFMLVIRSDNFAQRWCKYVEAVDIKKKM